MSEFIPSPYQSALFDEAEHGKGNVVVKAGAGSGKTTSIVQLVKRLTGSYVALSFNKPIQVEMEKRGLNARTFHSLCMGIINRTGRYLDKDKVPNFIRERFTEDEYELYAAFVNRLVGLAKNEGIGALSDDTEQAWSDLANHHDMELEYERAQWSEAIDLSRRVLAWSNKAPTYDFNDALYFVVKEGIALPKFDNVIIDEAQDVNKIQLAIIRKLMHENSRLFAVGDDAQAIYGFRGADSDAIDNIVREFDAKVLPLTVSYRCAKSIVQEASKYGAIEAAPNAAEGIVRKLPALNKDAVAGMKAGDLVLARCTKPVIEAAYSLLRVNKPAFVMGRDIGKGLVALVAKMNSKGIDKLVQDLEEYTSREVEKAKAKGQDSKAEAIQDKTDCVLFLIDNLPETRRTVPALIETIEELFKDKSNAVVLATVHRSKGLEAECVYWLNYDYVSKWARKEWQQKQEQNLRYVAASRAKQELVLIPSPKKAA